jgi:hypothetical protein
MIMGIQGVALKKSDIIAALHKSGGIITETATNLKCSSQSIYAWVDRDEDVKKALEEARAFRNRKYQDDDISLVKEAREAYHRLLKSDNAVIAMFIGKTKGGFEGDGMGNTTTINIIVEE